MAKKPNSTTWKPGQSGNPGGRRPGTGKHAALRKELAEHAPTIMKRMVELAEAGDPACIRMVMERLLPPLKASELPVQIAMQPEASLSDKAQTVLQAIVGGDVPPGQGSALLSAVAALARVVEVDELAKRVEALEAARQPGVQS